MFQVAAHQPTLNPGWNAGLHLPGVVDLVLFHSNSHDPMAIPTVFQLIEVPPLGAMKVLALSCTQKKNSKTRCETQFQKEQLVNPKRAIRYPDLNQ